MITAADQARRKGLVSVCRESNTEGDNCTQQGKRRDTLPLDRLHKREADRSRKPNKQRQGKAGIKTIFVFLMPQKAKGTNTCNGKTTVTNGTYATDTSN